MKNKIYNIIEKYAEIDYMSDDCPYEYLHKDDFVKVAQEIVKLFTIPDVVGQREQLLAFGWYLMEHSNANDGKRLMII